MTRNDQWLTFVQTLQSLTALKRPLRVCLDAYFADESDFGTLPVLFPYVERVGLILTADGEAVYRHMLKSRGWDKVVPVVEGDQFSGYWDIIINRW